jgi:hypothetical protein
MERPDTVRFGTGAFVASLLVGLISSLVTLSDFDAYVDRAMAAGAATDTPGVTLSEDAVRDLIVAGLAFGLVLVALEIMFIAFAWQGRNWARIVLWVLGGLGIAGGLLDLLDRADGNWETGFTTSMGAFQLLFTAAGIVLLAMKSSNDWYRYRRRQRADGQN